MQAIELTTDRTEIAAAIPNEPAQVSTAVAFVASADMAVDAVNAVAVITAHCTIRFYTYEQLYRHTLNVRTVSIDVDFDKPDPELEQLAQLIASQGLLQNLIGVEEVVQGNVYTGRVGIVAGGRRLAAIGLLLHRGVLPADFGIQVLIVTEEEAARVSLAENSGRKDMHHADVVAAMLSIFQSGIAVADIALAFGVEEIIVRRRLKLANVAPKLFNLYRADKVNFDQMVAYSITDDHAKQLAVLEQLGDRGSAWNIKKLLTAQQVSASDKVAKYVTVKAYEAAGGEIVRDLFSSDEQCYLSDTVTLNKLAHTKLQKKAQKIEKSYPWVEVRVSFTQADKSEFAAVRKYTRPLTDDESAKIAAIEEEAKEVEAKLEQVESESEEEAGLFERSDKLDDELRSIRNSLYGDHEGDKALAGAVVTIDDNGQATVITGLIRAEDKSKMAKIEKPKAGGDDDAARGHSDRLTRILTSHRTVALQAELVQRPDVALVVATHALVCEVFGGGVSHGTITSRINMGRPSLDEDVADSKAQQAVDAKRAELEAVLPEDWEPNTLLPWMLEQPQAIIFDLLAFCTALSCDATLGRETTKSAAFVQVAQAVNLNVINWWQPTAQTYFAHISKTSMMEVVKQVAKIEDTVPMEKMKKAEAAAAAERSVAGSGWVPAMLQVQ